MNQFQYVARDRAGGLTRGLQTAESPQRLRSLLEATGLSLVSFSLQETASSAAHDSSETIWLSLPFVRPSGRAIELALTQMAMMLRSGLDLRGALQTVLEQTSSILLARALRGIIRDIENGHSLQSAMARSQVFPEIVTQLVGVGETTGNLSHVMQRSAEHLTQRRQSFNSVRMALAYPTVVAIAAISIAIYLIVAVIPELQKMLSAMGRKLPGMTQSLVDMSSWLQIHGSTCIVALIILPAATIAIHYWPPGRLWMDRWLLRMPLVGSILRLSGTATLASSLAVMIRSGTRLVDALTIAERLQNNRALAARVEHAKSDVMHGQSLARELARQPGYVPMLPSMLNVAERTGQLEQSLEEVATYCDAELQSRIKRMSLMVEPAIIVFAGVVVGYVYMAFFMALMSAGGNIR